MSSGGVGVLHMKALSIKITDYGDLSLVLSEVNKIGRKHPSRDVIFSGQNLAKKCQKLSLYMTSSNL